MNKTNEPSPLLAVRSNAGLGTTCTMHMRMIGSWKPDTYLCGKPAKWFNHADNKTYCGTHGRSVNASLSKQGKPLCEKVPNV